MYSSWTEAFSQHTRSTRDSYDYASPPLWHGGLSIHGNGSADRFATESYSPGDYRFNNRFDTRQPDRTYSIRGRGRGRGRGCSRGGDGGGRGRGRGRDRDQLSGSYPTRDAEPDPFLIVEKFDKLEMIESSNGETGIDFDAYDDIPVQSTGEDIPPAVNTFAEIDLGKALNDNIKRCKYVKPTPIQRHAIPIVVAGRDLMACAQTGSGKTAAFCFPIISNISRNKESLPSVPMFFPRDGGGVASPVALILSPTRELSCQIHDEAKKFAYQTGVKIVVVYGGAPISHQLQKLEKGVDILVATPGRLVDLIEREQVSLRKLKYLTLDEADRMLDMGFEPQIRRIVEQLDMPPTGSRQTMLFSATFPDEIQRLASDFLSNYIFLSVGRVGSSADGIAQRVEYVEDTEKRNKLLSILKTQKGNGTHGKLALMLIFVETKRGADSLEHWLFKNGFSAIAIHGDKVQMERERALRSFRTGATPIMVATDVAARGLDISHVSHVINFDFPKSIDDYVHRIGRTGRAGKSGTATAFFNEGDAALAKPLMELMQEAKQEVPDWLSKYAENSASYITGNGRGDRYRNGKFGGRDYRDNYDSTVQCTPYSGNSTVVNYADGSIGYLVDVSSVVATGWD